MYGIQVMDQVRLDAEGVDFKPTAADGDSWIPAAPTTAPVPHRNKHPAAEMAPSSANIQNTHRTTSAAAGVSGAESGAESVWGANGASSAAAPSGGTIRWWQWQWQQY